MEESSRVSVDTKNESGQVLVFVAILLAAVIGLSAFVIDLGYAYYAQRTREAVKLEPFRICLKDPGGLLTPERTRALVPLMMARAVC